MRFIPVVVLALGILLQGSTTRASEIYSAPEWRRISFPPADVIAPDSVSDNQDAVFAIVGAYPDACYRNGPLGVRVDANSGQIVVQNEAWRMKSDFCAFQLRPFARTINLGKLRPGTYKIYSRGENFVLREHAVLLVERSE